MKLRAIGFFREMSQGKETDPSIYDFVKKGDPSLVEKICNYLSNGTTLIVSPGITLDILDEAAGVAGTGSSCTDGIWLWPDDLAYYVRKYNIALPDDFINTMKFNNWSNPGIDIDLSNVDFTIDGMEI